ncbi:MAG: cytochrome c [Candidatus Accumulibacter propinquus]
MAKAKEIAGGVCVACHGADGNSPAAANPILAGQIPQYLYKQLSNFKAVDGKPAVRNNAIMGGMVAALSDEDMRSLSVYFSQQKMQPSVAKDENCLRMARRFGARGISRRAFRRVPGVTALPAPVCQCSIRGWPDSTPSTRPLS